MSADEGLEGGAAAEPERDGEAGLVEWHGGAERDVPAAENGVGIGGEVVERGGGVGALEAPARLWQLAGRLGAEADLARRGHEERASGAGDTAQDDGAGGDARKAKRKLTAQTSRRGRKVRRGGSACTRFQAVAM